LDISSQPIALLTPPSHKTIPKAKKQIVKIFRFSIFLPSQKFAASAFSKQGSAFGEKIGFDRRVSTHRHLHRSEERSLPGKTLHGKNHNFPKN
jgi:hypothetical protein